ncbi:notch-regulated ankyrin repeat-containing protein [Varanus komodoensis]|uniref:notch-regulated ankyrin repeat-containing protein n=1 Tax=Varanus komodoensis TaxID=61221 RepID=UPI001CF780E9|nr:notch-regulated ankyrin repeat-containing protein [Varanus komodoensis]
MEERGSKGGAGCGKAERPPRVCGGAQALCALNVNSFGPEGQTALHQSVIDGNLELVKLLVKFGADIRLANRDGWSALHIAAFGGHQDIVLYLIAKAKYSSGSRG